MKTRFVTTLRVETIEALKQEAEKNFMPVNGLIEKIVKEYFESKGEK